MCRSHAWHRPSRVVPGLRRAPRQCDAQMRVRGSRSKTSLTCPTGSRATGVFRTRRNTALPAGRRCAFSLAPSPPQLQLRRQAKCGSEHRRLDSECTRWAPAHCPKTQLASHHASRRRARPTHLGGRSAPLRCRCYAARFDAFSSRRRRKPFPAAVSPRTSAQGAPSCECPPRTPSIRPARMSSLALSIPAGCSTTAGKSENSRNRRSSDAGLCRAFSPLGMRTLAATAGATWARPSSVTPHTSAAFVTCVSAATASEASIKPVALSRDT